jgi:hypothetical protein
MDRPERGVEREFAEAKRDLEIVDELICMSDERTKNVATGIADMERARQFCKQSALAHLYHKSDAKSDAQRLAELAEEIKAELRAEIAAAYPPLDEDDDPFDEIDKGVIRKNIANNQQKRRNNQ